VQKGARGGAAVQEKGVRSGEVVLEKGNLKDVGF
jgi:hypothetical protein